MELRLIPELSGDATQNVVEWLKKAELVCNLRGIAHLKSVIPLRLTGGAFAVYQQLPDADKLDSGKITKALRTVFAVDSFTAYEQFVGRRLQPGETVDVFMAELRRLAVPFGRLSDIMLACALVAGLPDTVKQLLRAGSRMDELPLAHILTRARAILTDEVGIAAAVSAMTVGAGASVKRADATSGLLCFQCNQPNHLAIYRLLHRKAGLDEVLDVAAPGVIGVMAWVSLRRRVRETRTGEAVCASLQSRHPVMPPSHRRRGATTVFSENRHHRIFLTPPVVFHSFPLPVTPVYHSRTVTGSP